MSLGGRTTRAAWWRNKCRKMADRRNWTVAATRCRSARYTRTTWNSARPTRPTVLDAPAEPAIKTLRPNDMGICSRRHFLLTICSLQLVSSVLFHLNSTHCASTGENNGNYFEFFFFFLISAIETFLLLILLLFNINNNINVNNNVSIARYNFCPL